jgi:tRNA 5-methylaminomethyl-2-thiouridine biosynthesis bifunctional protein
VSHTQTPLQPAVLDWHGDTPEATAFGDVYFSRENGLAESTHVFLRGNALAERFAALQDGAHFVIGETGFGTGLNCLLAWQLWQARAPSDAQLFFISTEQHPLHRADLATALGHWPTLAPYAQALLAHYPPLLPGSHWLKLAPNVTLLLLFGDARETLPALHDSAHSAFEQCNAWQVDAWFLDGFAPSRNPALWEHSVFRTLASFSKQGTTLATFTSAGEVRRGLQAVGFSVSKTAGYGRKREMVTALFTRSQTTHTPLAHKPLAHTSPARTRAEQTSDKTPWLLNSHAVQAQSVQARALPAPQHVAVIGGGLAGCHVARALAERGCQVTLYERHAQLASEASGNAQGALYTKLSANTAALSAFGLSSLQYALRHYRQTHFKEAFSACGLLQLQGATDQAVLDLFQHAPELAQWLTAEQGSTMAGIPVTQSGWWLPHAGWLAPAHVCAALVQHTHITVCYEHDITHIQRDDSGWQLQFKHADLHAVSSVSDVVLACAHGSHALLPDISAAPLRVVRGQVSMLPATTASRALRCVVCEEGYIAPAHDDAHCVGASFVPDDACTDLRNAEHRHNLGLLQAISPVLANAWTEASGGRAALRATTPDHLPLVGAVPDVAAFQQQYAGLRHNARATIPLPGCYLNGLWLCTAFGGRGLCYIPLAAELLASQLLNQPRPLSRPLQMALAPARFILRSLIREMGQRGQE